MGRNLRGTFWRSQRNNIKFTLLWPQFYVVCSVVLCFVFVSYIYHISYHHSNYFYYLFMITLADLFQLYCISIFYTLLFLFYYISILYTLANLKNHKKTSIIYNQTKILKHITSKKLLDWSLRWVFERDYSWKVWERNFDVNNLHFMNHL